MHLFAFPLYERLAQNASAHWPTRTSAVPLSFAAGRLFARVS